MVCVIVCGVVHGMGNGKITRFFHDLWIGSVPLRILSSTMMCVAVNLCASRYAETGCNSFGCIALMRTIELIKTPFIEEKNVMRSQFCYFF